MKRESGIGVWDQSANLIVGLSHYCRGFPFVSIPYPRPDSNRHALRRGILNPTDFLNEHKAKEGSDPTNMPRTDDESGIGRKGGEMMFGTREVGFLMAASAVIGFIIGAVIL